MNQKKIPHTKNYVSLTRFCLSMMENNYIFKWKSFPFPCLTPNNTFFIHADTNIPISLTKKYARMSVVPQNLSASSGALRHTMMRGEERE